MIAIACKRSWVFINATFSFKTVQRQHYSLKQHLTRTNKHEMLSRIKKQRTEITIKPADKNLGIVILDTDDYTYNNAVF